MGEKLKIPELKVYSVAIVAPDPFSAWTVQIPAKHLWTLKSFIEEFKAFHDDLDREEQPKIATMFGLRQVRLKTVKKVNIIHLGRGSSAKMIIALNTMPTALYTATQKAKYRIYSWLWNNAVVVPNRPENMYLLPPNRLPELRRIVREVNEYLSRVNVYAGELWESTVKQKLEELATKHGLVQGDEKLSLEIKWLKPINPIITPIHFGSETLVPLLEADPQAEQIIRESFREYITGILRNVHDRLRYIVEGLLKNRSIKVDAAKKNIDRATSLLRELGLQVIAERVRAEYLALLEDPSRLKSYVDWEEVVSDINTRLLSLI